MASPDPAGDWPAPQAPFPPQQSPQPVRRRSKVPLVIGIVVASILLLCGIGIVLVAVNSDDIVDAANAAASSAASAAANPSADPSAESVKGDLDQFKAGDCMTVTGTNNKVQPAKCTDKGAYKVLLRKDGTTSESACDSTDATETMYQDDLGTKNDFILCIAPVS